MSEWSLPDNATEPISLQGPEPVDQELVVAVTEVGHGLQDVGEHGVGWLGGEYRVEEEDEQSSHVVFPEVHRNVSSDLIKYLQQKILLSS